ncbi:uncharacterized protein TM35_000084060 [Trypanosoma theileri]|uniref:WW domain-containing protein n=1 Tax=Trypanosoma theileri TaxID=67003 RepID=A0A1X0P1A6_9TRYP|nr:uncharacterized protein TM35_000084060 [Trypanosoma theileri]ORC90608.1 hypothetical protein TM35_000084060 [Trypanosoma theileri]
MSRRGFGAHRDRSPDTTDGRNYTRPRTEVPHRRTPPPLPQLQLQKQEQEQQVLHRPNVGTMTEEDLYAMMCSSDGEVLPPGWEKILYHGTVVYLDHISREAHEVRPWEVWQRRAEGGK